MDACCQELAFSRGGVDGILFNAGHLGLGIALEFPVLLRGSLQNIAPVLALFGHCRQRLFHLRCRGSFLLGRPVDAGAQVVNRLSDLSDNLQGVLPKIDPLKSHDRDKRELVRGDTHRNCLQEEVNALLCRRGEEADRVE